MRPIPGTITDPASTRRLDAALDAPDDLSSLYDPVLQESESASNFTLDQYQKLAAETAMYPRVYTEAQVADMLYEALCEHYTDYAVEQKTERLLAKYETPFNRLVYPILGLVGEAGELANKLKKVARDDQGQMDLDRSQDIATELGDVNWYSAAIATELGTTLGAVARSNIRKLFSRRDRGVLGGDGDNR